MPDSLALVGDYEWGPSSDSLHWFLERIFPKLLERRPETKLHLIGQHVPAQIMNNAPRNVVIRGLVPDFKKELQRYEMLVVPLRVGGGIRLKILEGFAMGVPVVSTSIGCEGIEAVHEEHLLVGDWKTTSPIRLWGCLRIPH